MAVSHCLRRAGISAEDLFERQLWFHAASGGGERKRRDLVLAIQFIDGLVCRGVGEVLQQERRRIGGGFRLGKDWLGRALSR